MRVASNCLLPNDRSGDGVVSLRRPWAHRPIILDVIVAASAISVLVDVAMSVKPIGMSELLQGIVNIS
jgi:hypothetical protein